MGGGAGVPSASLLEGRAPEGGGQERADYKVGGDPP